MPRWLRFIRGMIGTGLTFAAGVGVVTSIIGGVSWLGGGVTVRDFLEFVGKFSFASFLLGVAFSGVLAVAARGRHFSKLSLRLVSALGAGAGLLYFGFLAMNGGRNWSPRAAMINFAVLTVMGACSAAATLLIARRASSALDSEETQSLGAGPQEFIRDRGRSKVEVPKV